MAGWDDEVNCADMDTELFFDERRHVQRRAVKVCVGCPARAGCLQFALDMFCEFGVFGGLTPVQRRRLQRTRRAG